MLTDVEIAQSVAMRPISAIAERLGVEPQHVHQWGLNVAKINPDVLSVPRTSDKPSRLVLVTAITPTRAGEGKTTTSIGLGQALDKLGQSVCIALREPSLGPCMGIKGGATGGGWSQVVPADSINLHFTGDFHAITSAHNLVAALIDNKLHFRSRLGIDERRVIWPRVIDMNDRTLRNIVIGLGGNTQGVPRESGFDITAASEIMAILCLSKDTDDLRRRLQRTIVAFTRSGEPITIEDLKATGAVHALLRDAMMPNLVQTLEGTPVLIHGGPFANIAHGCNSVIATKTALHLADWTVTEAGFGSDLGAEKFFDIKCTKSGFDPAAVVCVATVRALKMHGGVKRKALAKPDVDAVQRGMCNLGGHLDGLAHYGKPLVVAINRFGTDSDEELQAIASYCEDRGVRHAISDHFGHGGEGALELGRVVMEAAQQPSEPFIANYTRDDPVDEKIRKVACRIYGADDVVLTLRAKKDIKQIERLGYGHFPVCIAKTQSSLSDDAKLRGRPTGFEVHVQEVKLNAGAGFLVVMTGEIMRMPGLPRVPQAGAIDVDADGTIVGIA